MPNLYPLARPFFGVLRPERARDLTIWCLEAGLGSWMVSEAARIPDSLLLAQRIWDLDFPNPVGLAAGFDKDARAPDAVLNHWRCGFVEVGTVTPQPQYGNKKPRVFRLRADSAIVNRMGFNSRGLRYAVERLQQRVGQEGIVGLNLGKNKDSQEAAADYEAGIRAAAHLASYLVINVSSPNTPGLRDLQRRSQLEQLLKTLINARDATGRKTPLLVKIAPDLSRSECEDVAGVAQDCGINGIIVSNTTVDRPGYLLSRAKRESGGLSGTPLFDPSTTILAQIYTLTKGQIPLIGVGGISTAADAYAKICAGASLVQLYTALAFHGPMLVSEIKWGLANLLASNGFQTIQDAVGTTSGIWASNIGSNKVNKTPQSRQKPGPTGQQLGRRISGSRLSPGLRSS